MHGFVRAQEDAVKVAVRIKELVDERGWNAQQLAQTIGTDEQTARSLYDGQPTELDLAALGHLAEALGVTPPEIVAEVQEKQPSVEVAPSPRSIAVGDEVV